MLFHVTMTHTPEDCPAYNKEMMPDLIASVDKIDAVGKELNVKAHLLLWGAPEHVAYAILEADSPGAVTRYLNTIAIKQDFKVTPVQRLQEVMEMAKAMIAK